MPVFEVKGPDGKTYEVEAPDAQSAAGALGSPQKDAGISWSEVPEDIARSTVAGLGRGAIAVAGLPGDIQHLTNEGMNWVLGENVPYNGPTSERLISAANHAIRPAPSLSQLVTGEKPKTFMEHEPQSRLGKFGRTFGEFAPGLVTGPGGRLVRAGATLTAAGASETAGQLTEGTPYEPYARGAAAIVGGLAGGRMTARPTEADLIRHAVPDDLTAYRTLGPEAMVLDASPATVGLAQGVSVAPGTAKNQIVQALMQRDAGRSNRLVADTEAALGRPHDADMLKQALDRAAQRQAGPMYEGALRNAQPLPANIDDTLAVQLTSPADTLSMGSRKAMMPIMDEIDDALKAGNPEVTGRRLHDIRKRLDAQIVYDPRAREVLSSADKANQGILGDARKTVDDLLKNRYPGFAEADEVISTAKRFQDDVDYGRGALEGGKYASTPERFRTDIGTRDRQMVGEGMKHDIRVSMGTQANDLPALRKKVGGDNDFNREKLSAVFGQDSVDRLTNAVGREQTFGQNYADIARNSQTAQRRAAAEVVAGTDAPRFSGQETVTGMTLKGLGKAASSLLTRARVASSQPARDALVRALLTRGAEGEALMRAAQSSSPLAGTAVRALVQAIASSANARLGAN